MDLSLLFPSLIFAALLSIGFGVPIPEEGALLLAAYLIATGMPFWPVFVACLLGIVVADALMFARGRARAGIFTKFKEGRKFIASAGFFAVFSSRFIIATRMVVPFMAGAMKMSRFSFHVASILSAALASLIILFLGKFVYSVLALWTVYAPFLWMLIIMVTSGVLIMFATRAQVKLREI